MITLSCKVNAQQSYSLTGKILNESSLPVEHASVVVVNSLDSIIFDFTISKHDGTFNLAFGRPIDGIVFVSFNGYADYAESFNLNDNTNMIDLGDIMLTLKGVAIEEVLVQARIAMTQKGDTLEYDASRYQIEPNDRVEDLLTKLPGILVGKDGKIISQGKQVRRVLVDGEIFFGDDPTLVTKNIRADMVDKIQVYDRPSIKEEMTGIKDNDGETTINVKLKENMKHGVFGKASLAYGNEDFHEAIFMFNKFRGNEKVSGYGIVSSTGQIGLGYDDNRRFGNNQASRFSSSTGKYIGEGLPKVTNVGLNYSNKFDEDRQNISTNAHIRNFVTRGIRNVTTQNNAIDNFYQYTNQENFDSQEKSQGVFLDYGYAVNERNTLKLNFEAKLEQSNDTKASETQIVSQDSKDLNKMLTNAIEGNDKSHYNLNTSWQTKFMKKGRNLFVSIGRSQILENSTININNLGGMAFGDSTYTEIEKKSRTLHTNQYLNISYSEPLKNNLNLLTSYGFNHTDANRNVNTFDEVLQLNDEASGEYNFITQNHSGNLLLTWRKGKWGAEGGTRATLVRVSQNQWRVPTNSFRRSEFYLLPRFKIDYTIHSNRSLTFSFNRTINIPDINRIQPFYNIEDPLNISRGSANLQDELSNNFNVVYHNFKLTKMRVIRATLDYSIIENPFGWSTHVDDNGINYIEPINILNHKRNNIQLYSHFGKEISSQKDYFMVKFEGNYQDNYQRINNELNQLKYYNSSIIFSLTRPIGSELGFNVAFGPVYNNMASSLNKVLDNKGVGWKGDGELTLKLPYTLRLTNSLNYMYAPSTRVFNTEISRLLWDMSLQKTFLKDQSLGIAFRVNDLLNHNVGLRRFNSNFGFTETNYTAIGRFFMLTVSWDFNKMNER